MSNFIGKMSYEEFIDAIKIILSKEGEEDNIERKTLKERIDDCGRSFVDFVKYVFSVRIFKDLLDNVIKFFKWIFSIFTLQFWIGVKNNILEFLGFGEDEEEANTEPEELTKEVFIRKGKKVKAFIWETVDTIVFVVVMVILIRFFLGEIRWIPSGSMHPTLYEGDRIFVERYSRFYRAPERGDIMVFYPPFETLKNTPLKVFSRLTGFFCKDIAYIKRVVGLPGEKFEIKFDADGKGMVYINDKPLEELYIQSPYDYTPCSESMHCGPEIIPEGQYLMLGDNRGNSQDGRYWGLLPKERFIGRAVFLFWPLTRIKTLRLD